MLQVTLATQKDLPSVHSVSQQEADLREKVFNFVLGTVNTNRGTAVYSSLINNSNSRSTFNLGTGLTTLIWSQMLLGQVYHQLLTCCHIHWHHSMDPVRCHWIELLMSVGFLPPNIGNAQETATIVAEVLAAAAAQASKEFRCMQEPEITKLCGRYSADAELVFQSWQVDISGKHPG